MKQNMIKIIITETSSDINFGKHVSLTCTHHIVMSKIHLKQTLFGCSSPPFSFGKSTSRNYFWCINFLIDSFYSIPCFRKKESDISILDPLLMYNSESWDLSFC